MKRVIKASTSIDVFDIIDHEIRRALKDAGYRAYAQLVKEYENGQGPHPGDQHSFIWDLLHDDNVWNLRKDFTSAIHRAIDDHMKEREAE